MTADDGLVTKIGVEHEVKLFVPDALTWQRAVAAVIRQPDAGTARPGLTRTLYLDTVTGALAARRTTLCVTFGTGDRVMVKLKDTVAWTGPLRHALEVAVGAHRRLVDAALAGAATLLPFERARVPIADLRGVLVAVQRRTAALVAVPDGHFLQVALDEVAFARAGSSGGERPRVRLLELEANVSDAACLELLDELAARALATGALGYAYETKASLGEDLLRRQESAA